MNRDVESFPGCLDERHRQRVVVVQPLRAFLGRIAFGKGPLHFRGIDDVIQPHDGIVKIMQRNEVLEDEFMALLQTLHTDIQLNKKDKCVHHYYSLVIT